MALIHDLVEIDAGDTFIYDAAAAGVKIAPERRAADRIFGMLPAGQGEELRALWEEFEARQTPDARFAAALDRIEPIIHNYHTQGGAWKEHGVKASSVIAKGYLEDDRTSSA